MKRIALVLAAWLPLGTGCGLAAHRAEAYARALKPGMSQAEVRAIVGSPDKVARIDRAPGIEEQVTDVWVYEFAPGVPFDEVVLAILTVAAVAGVAAATGGAGRLPEFRGPSSRPSPSSRALNRPHRFIVGFDPDGRLRQVSRVEAIK